jgi:hypothetical protein
MALVTTEVSEECTASIIRLKRIGELGTMLAVTTNRIRLRSVLRLLVTTNNHSSSLILVPLMMEQIHSPKRRFLQEPHGVISQEMTFFIVTAVKTSNLTRQSEVDKTCRMILQNLCNISPTLRFTKTTYCLEVVSSISWKRVSPFWDAKHCFRKNKFTCYEEWRLLGCYAVWLL